MRLVIAPHGDDEAYGCGGMLAKHGDGSVVVFVAAPDFDRVNEIRCAQAVLGYGGWMSLGLPDGAVGDDMPRLVGLLDEVFEEMRPDEVYLPYPGLHQDHVASFEAGMRAVRLSTTESHWMPPTVLVYDVPVYDLDLVERGLRFSVFEELTEQQVDLKARAIGCYESQSVPGPHPGGSDEVLAHAMALGAARGLVAAEAFAPVRMIR